MSCNYQSTDDLKGFFWLFKSELLCSMSALKVCSGKTNHRALLMSPLKWKRSTRWSFGVGSSLIPVSFLVFASYRIRLRMRKDKTQRAYEWQRFYDALTLDWL